MDDVSVVNRRLGFEMLSNRLYDERLDLGRRRAAYRPGLVGSALEEGGRQIVPVLDAPLSGMSRAHEIAPIVEDASDQQCPRLHSRGPVVVDLLVQLGLHG